MYRYALTEQDPRVTSSGKVLRSRARAATMDESVATKLKEHQRELIKQRQQDGMARFNEKDDASRDSKEKIFKKFESYRRGSQLPSKVDELRVCNSAGTASDSQIMVDSRAHSLLLPIYGFAVPFHIKTVKNVSKSDEGEYTYLRINFVTPGQLAGKKDDVPFDDPDATFIRNISYRSKDARHFESLYQEISEMRRLATKREAERKEMADVIEQDQLVLNSASCRRECADETEMRPLSLPEVFPRPALEGKRVPGNLTIHQNGLRFLSPLRQDQKIGT